MIGDEGYIGPERRQDSLSVKAEELSEAVGTLNRSVVDLTHYGRQNRRLIRRVTAGLVGLLLMVVVVAAVAWIAINASEQAKDATSAAVQNRQNAKVACLASNEARSAQIRLWSYVLDASGANPDLTPPQRKLITDFRVYINAVFAPRNCDDPSAAPPTPTPPALTPTR